MSQFEHSLSELEVQVIHAQSPQAKGRIERLFQTFQDWLIKEMRLAGLRTLEEANRFLERYLLRCITSGLLLLRFRQPISTGQPLRLATWRESCV